MHPTNEQSEPCLSDRHFAALVENAADFLSRSVDDLVASDVKFSVVHFCQAIELFMKARLLLEHWSLVLTDPSKAARANFEQGDFQSVSLSEAIDRLVRIAGEDLRSARKAFEPIQRRRNRVVHFHATEYPRSFMKGGRAGSPAGIDNVLPPLGVIIAEQCRAWYELHQLLTGRWKSHFRQHLWKCHWLDHRMLAVRPYLQTRFEQLAPQIAKLRAAGPVHSCPACGFEAAERREIVPDLVHVKCLVCRKSERTFSFPCDSECGGRLIATNKGVATCDRCGTTISMLEMLEMLAPLGEPGEVGGRTRVYCSDCESLEAQGGTVLAGAGNCLLCLSCLSLHNCIVECDGCWTPIACDADNNHMPECLHCRGRSGNNGDDAW